MKSLRAALVCLIAVAMLGCATVHKVYKSDSNGVIEREGVYYTLPKTILKADFPITMTETVAGKFTDRIGLLHKDIRNDITNGILSVFEADDEGKSFEIKTDTITLSKLARPDEKQKYFVELKGGNPLTNRSILLSLNKYGLISAYNSSATDRTAEFVAKAAEIALKLGAPAGGVAALGGSNKTAAKLEANKINAIHTEIESLLTTMADSGSVSPTLNAYWESRLGELRTQKAALLKNYLGHKKTAMSWTAQFEIDVAKTNNLDTTDYELPLFHLHKSEGFEEAPGAPEPVNAVPEWVRGPAASKSDTGTFRLAVGKLDTAVFPHTIPSNVPEDLKKPRGFYYRLPALAAIRIDVQDGNAAQWNSLLKTSEFMSQLGIVRSLPSRLGALKQVGYTTTFDVDSGALTQIGVDTVAHDPALADPVVAAYLEYRKAVEAAEAAKEAEKTTLDEFLARQATRSGQILQILDNNNKIRNLFPQFDASQFLNTP